MITCRRYDPVKIVNYFEFVPYITTMTELYNAGSLYRGYDPDRPETFATCYDQEVYRYYLERGKMSHSAHEVLARAAHDHNIMMHLLALLECYDRKKVVGVMGGSAMMRNDPVYKDIVNISRKLTQNGTLMASGGGSGAMEATSLGGFMASRTEEEVNDAIRILAQHPTPSSEGYFAASYEVLRKYPHDHMHECLSIPTWLYGHEPTAPFATHIAKFFDNSIREDILLTVTYGGIIFTPGSAGTMQEVFQEAVQNHYLTLGMASPMVFLDKKFWTEEFPVYPLLKELSDKGKYKNMLLSITDSPDEAVEIIQRFQNA